MTDQPWYGQITPELQDLLERSRNYNMAPGDRREQRINFVFSMLSSKSPLTKDYVRKIMEDQGL